MRKKKSKARAARAWAAVRQGPDPLSRQSRSKIAKALTSLLFLAGAGAGHGLIAGSIIGVQGLFGGDEAEELEENIEIAIVDETPPAPEEVEGAEEEEEEAPAVPEPEPEPKPEPKKSVKEAPPDPINKPAAEPPEIVDDKPPPRKIVGLNFESTVEGGDGPSFATGNTRSGKTSSKANDPSTVASSSSLQPEKTNRQAQFIPSAKSKLSKPKIIKRIVPDYPQLYNEQGLSDRVLIEVDISAEGKVTSASFLKKSEHELFNVSAMKAAKRQRFKPAVKDGEAISFRITLPYTFEPPR